jgi:RHS repeat-associated protein
MRYKLTFAIVASLTSTAFAEFKAPLPEFKNEKQLAEWRAEKASEATNQSYASEEAAFYTGKPYLASSGGYTFKYRNYNPEVARWTTEDPSGFPDGANNIFYAPNPLTGIDPLGLSGERAIVEAAIVGFNTAFFTYAARLANHSLAMGGDRDAAADEIESMKTADPFTATFNRDR